MKMAHLRDLLHVEEESIDLPTQSVSIRTPLAIEIGQYMLKVAYIADQDTNIHVRLFSLPLERLDDVISALKASGRTWRTVSVFGEKASYYRQRLLDELDTSIVDPPDTVSLCADGFRLLVDQLPARSILQRPLTSVLERAQVILDGVMESFKKVEEMGAVSDNMKGWDEQGNVNMSAGSTYLCEQEGCLQLSYPVMLCDISAPAIIWQINADGSSERLNVSTRGGATFVGLGKLFTGAKNYEQLIALAESGKHDQVNFLAKHFYPDQAAEQSEEDPYTNMFQDLLYYTFGRASEELDPGSFSREDLAAALLVTLCTDLAQYCRQTSAALTTQPMDRMFICGDFPGMSELVRNQLTYFLRLGPVFPNSLKTPEVHFLKFSSYLGVLGSLLCSRAVMPGIQQHVQAGHQQHVQAGHQQTSASLTG